MEVLGKNQRLSSFLCSDTDVKYNVRRKYIVDDFGEVRLIEEMVSRRFIFNPDGAEVSQKTLNYNHKLDLENTLDEMYGLSGHYQSVTSDEENIARSKRRAKRKLFDYIIANDFDVFCTLTLSADKINRYDYNTVIKKLSTYLDNRVRRNGLYYVGVPELHKKGGFHFHFLCNSSALNLVDSGTVSVPNHKRPIKVQTADRLNVPLQERKTVYNISDWSLGFTTAIKTYGERGAVANYVGKYITKGVEKIGGRWYYSGGKLKQPIYKYDRISFDDFKDFDYEFNCDGGNFKVKKYEENYKKN